MICSWKLCCMKIPQRWVFAVMGCLAFLNGHSMGSCFNMAITQMVAPKDTLSNDTWSDTSCPAFESLSLTTHRGDIYDWDEHTQGIILSSFFWGYVITQIPGGILATKFGGKYVLGLSIFSIAVFTILTPTVARAYDAIGLIVIRILTGFNAGMAFPAMIVLISEWAPPHERSRTNTVVMAGMQLGNILSTSLSGILIEHSPVGWPMPFYVFGSSGILWFFAWIVLCYNNPDVHPFIGEKEKTYLRQTMNRHLHRKIQPTPWRHILTSGPVWAMLAGKFGHDWGMSTIVIFLPKYLSSVLKFPIQMTGFLTAFSNSAMWVIGMGSAWFADWLTSRDEVSRTNVRKIFNSIGVIGAAVFLIAASYAGCDRTTAVILFTVSVGMMGSGYPGVYANPLDLSPNYAGTLASLMATIPSLSGILAPYTVGSLTPNQALLEWRMAYCICFFVLCVSSLIFNLWADGEVQYWNDLDSCVYKQKVLEQKDKAQSLKHSSEANRTMSDDMQPLSSNTWQGDVSTHSN